MAFIPSWRLGSTLALCIVASVVAFSLLLGQPTSACAAGLQVPCGYARIEGKVSAGDTGVGLASATVLVASTSAADFATSTSTEADGTYSVDIPVAVVGQNFNLSAVPGFLDDRYLASPEVVAVEIMSGTTTTRNFSLPLGAMITGQVESAKTSQPLTQTLVTAYRYDELSGKYVDELDFMSVNASGTYTLAGLRSGRYVLRYRPLDINIFHMSLFSGGAYRLEDAKAFTLTAPSVVEADISIGIGAQVEGVIRR